MKNTINQFKALHIMDKVLVVVALASVTGYLINAIKR